MIYKGDHIRPDFLRTLERKQTMHSIIKERLQLIFHHTLVIQNRIDRIQKAEELKNSEHGQMVLDKLPGYRH